MYLTIPLLLNGCYFSKNTNSTDNFKLPAQKKSNYLTIPLLEMRVNPAKKTNSGEDHRLPAHGIEPWIFAYRAKCVTSATQYHCAKRAMENFQVTKIIM